jgi:acetylornithine deacetylase/succinyl-diaminopimelate desuccinylase-like protein
MSFTENPITFALANRSRFVAGLKDFVRFPTVSAQPKHAEDLKDCAAWLANHLLQIGLEGVKIIPTRLHPIVYGQWLHAPGHPTVMIYGHYDVQPPDPLYEWHSPPFEPVVKGDYLYGRGACDDKGQMFSHVKAIESYLQTTSELPVNVKCLFEGEEETGSPNLTPFLSSERNALASDVAVISDMPILAPDRPAITYAMRGALSLELKVRGQKKDLHSGIFGGAVHNPLQALCEVIAKLHDAEGRVAIPGFYDNVRRWSCEKADEERAYMASVGPSDARILQDAQAEKGWGERGFTLYERTTIRPALMVNGILGGYQGKGVKAVIPSRAVAKLNFRLVPNQDPHEIDKLFRQYIARITPPTVQVAIHTSLVANPALISRNHPAMRAAAAAYRKGFGATPVFLRSGGTIPVVNLFQEILGIPTVLMGFALPDDRMHAPNEKFHLPNFFNGIKTSIWFLSEFGMGRELKTNLTRSRQSPRKRDVIAMQEGFIYDY